MTKLRNRTTKRIGATAAAVAAFAGLVVTAAPAAGATTTAYPTSPFTVSSGDGSYFAGTITWYNRSVSVSGTFKAVACRRVYGSTWVPGTRLDYRSTSTHCNALTFETIPLTANVAGGAGWVTIDLTDQNGSPLDSQVVSRP
jgi:hypothetical protein